MTMAQALDATAANATYLAVQENSILWKLSSRSTSPKYETLWVEEAADGKIIRVLTEVPDVTEERRVKRLEIGPPELPDSVWERATEEGPRASTRPAPTSLPSLPGGWIGMAVEELGAMDPQSRERQAATCFVTIALAETGRLQEALKMMKSSNVARLRSAAMAAICEHLDQSGELEAAGNVAKEIEDEHDRKTALHWHAVSLSEKDIDAAVELARQEEDPLKSQTLAQIALAASKRNDPEKIARTIPLVTEAECRKAVESLLLGAKAIADGQAAAEVAKKLPSDQADGLLMNVAIGQAYAGRVPQAEAILAAISKEIAVEGFTKAGGVLLDAGRRDDALRFARKAVDAVEKPDELYILPGLAELQVRLGATEEAAKTVALMRPRLERRIQGPLAAGNPFLQKDYKSLAVLECQTGQVGKAIDRAFAASSIASAGGLLDAVAGELAFRGDEQNLAKMLQRAGYALDYIRICCGAATGAQRSLQATSQPATSPSAPALRTLSESNTSPGCNRIICMLGAC
jgi:hypothetical protein